MSKQQPRIAVLLRHGDTGAHLRKHIVGGRSDYLPLIEHGRLQAPAVGAILRPKLAEILHEAGVADPETPVQIGDYSVSPIPRTVQTADLLGLDVPYQKDTRLIEWSKGHTEGENREAVETPAYRARAIADGWELLPDAGYEDPIAETPGQVRDRGYDYLNSRPVYEAGDTIRVSLAVTHGYLGAFTLARALHPGEDVSPQDAVQLYLPEYASAHVLVSPRDDQWRYAGYIQAPEVPETASAS